MATELATAYIALVPTAKGIKGNIESELGGAGVAAAGKTETAFSRSAGNVGSVLKGALVGAAVGGAAAFGAIKVGGELLNIGARVESFRQKSKTVFGAQSDDVRKWADKNNEAFGVTDDELVGLAANFGDLLKPMGFSSSEAAKMSTDVVGLSGALSSWSGGTVSAADASDILAKAMLGERDGLKSLGISISEADVQARLAAKGQEGLTGAALEQAKAVATQELIFEKSTDAQKAWADGGNKALLGQNKLKAAVGEAKESIATALTPALAAAAGWLGDRLPGAIAAAQAWFKSIQPTLQEVAAWLQEKIPPAVEILRSAFESAVGWVRENWPQIRETIAGVLSAVQTVIESVVSISLTIWKNFGDNVLAYVKAVWGPVQSVISGAMEIIKGIFSTVSALLKGDWSAVWAGIKQTVEGAFKFITGIFGVFREAVKLWLGIVVEILTSMWSKAWEAVKTVVSNAAGAIVDLVKGIPGRFVDQVRTMWDGITTGITVAKDWVRDRIGDLVGFVTGLPRRISSAAAGMFDGIKNAFRSALNWVIRAWNGLEFRIPGFDPPGPGPAFGGFSLGVPDIPEFHQGGIVPGARGDEVVIKALAGERVLTSAQAQAYEGAMASAAGGYTFAPTYNGILDAEEASALANAEWSWRMSLEPA